MPTADPAPARPRAAVTRPAPGGLPPRHRGAAGGRHPHRARVPRGPSGARRLRRRRHLLRHLRLPDHRPARRRARPQRRRSRGSGSSGAASAACCRPPCSCSSTISAWSWFVVPGLRRRDIGVDVAAAAMYVVNWVFARRETDYLASDVLPSPRAALLVAGRRGAVLRHLAAAAHRAGAGRAPAEPAGRRRWPSGRWWRRRSSGRCGSRTPRRARPSSPRRPGSGSSASGRCSPSRWPGGPGPTTAARGSAALGWAALAVLVAVALWLPQDIDWPGAWALLPTLPTAVLLWVGWQGPARGPVRVLGTAPMVWVGGLSYSIYLWHWPVIILGGWTAEAFGTTLPGWGVLLLALVSVVPGVAVVAVRRVADPPRPVAARPPAGAARRRARPVLRRRARRPAAVHAALALHHHAARRRPAAAVAARRRDAAAGAAVHAGRRPGLGHPRPARLGGGPAQGRRRPLPGARRRHHPGGVHLRRPAGQHHGRARRRLQGDAVAARAGGGRRNPRLAGGHLRQVLVRLLRRPPRPRRARPTPSATRGTPPSWTPCAPTRPTSSSPPGWRRAPGPAAEPSASPSSTATPRAGRTLADAGVPVVVVGDSPVSPDDLDVCAARHPTELTRCSFDTASAVARQRAGGAARRGRRGLRGGCRRAPARPHRR